ncbi:MAG: carbohydrate binding family 9 domain-containing protein [Planctomycetota bacterium]
MLPPSPQRRRASSAPRRGVGRWLLRALPWIVAIAPAFASPQTDAAQQQERPSARVVRLSPRDTIRVDGRLDESGWLGATRIGPLTQTLPVEGVEMTRDTDVRVTYDRDTVYVGITCYDDPKEIRARQMERDAFVRFDDVVELWFDPFASDRFAYWFQVTPAGSLGDALIADNGSSFNKDWDGIWYGEVQRTPQGWTAELAFPVKTLSFDPDAPYWGFNITRQRIANGERGRWASPSVAYPFFQVSDGGKLTGIDGLRQGVGLDVVPYVKFDAERQDADSSFDSAWDAGLDLRWRPTPASTVLLTINTDFAEAEVDTRQVNLGRFPLFFPERRDFFLEDAGVFEFGLPSNQRRLIPFFSRTIGRDEEGEVVPIIAGLKVTGRFGKWTVGALDTYIDEVPGRPPSEDDDGRERIAPQNLGVVRLQRALGDGQAVGAIVTTGDPLGDSGRYTAGADFRFGSSRLLGEGHSGFLWGHVLGTNGGETNDTSGLAYGLESRTRSRNWETTLRAQRTEEGFDPALGFVRRVAVDRYRAGAEYTWRSFDSSTLFRQVETGADVVAERDLAGNEDSLTIPIDLFDFQFWSQDSFNFRITERSETIDEAFTVGSATVVPGDYEETRFRLGFESNDRRLFGVETFVEVGDYYGGDIRRFGLEPIFIPSRFMALALTYLDVDIDVGAGGTFATQLYTGRLDLTFSPFISWNTFVQYDTESEDISTQTRLRWILEPGRELFVVGLFGFFRDGSGQTFQSGEQGVTVKLNYTLRF